VPDEPPKPALSFIKDAVTVDVPPVPPPAPPVETTKLPNEDVLPVAPFEKGVPPLPPEPTVTAIPAPGVNPVTKTS
jgi:hypothetical protein